MRDKNLTLRQTEQRLKELYREKHDLEELLNDEEDDRQIERIEKRLDQIEKALADWADYLMNLMLLAQWGST